MELPKRVIALYTQPGDVVLDPFMGSGSTAIAARLTGRHYVGMSCQPSIARWRRSGCAKRKTEKCGREVPALEETIGELRPSPVSPW